ncbi:MAG TPA: sigma-70 family RNA polymerase sigma factor [Planctomycetota bacterium]|nr:sigma-70 family RNA polymerase sigma factor [Planctomycetota bacterium]
MSSEPDDRELLARYATEASEDAFRTLLARHMAMVYSVCCRVLEDAHLAEDAAQATFVILSRKARTLGEGTMLADWLYRTAQYVARDLRRSTGRARRRELAAAAESARAAQGAGTHAGGASFGPSELRPILDAALVTLPASSRQALVLHYLEGRSREETSRILGCSLDALRMRIDYGLEKLREKLSRRGVSLSLALLGGWLLECSTETLPASAAAGAEAAALGSGAAAAALPATGIATSALRSMFWSKVRLLALSAGSVAGLLVLVWALSSAIGGPEPAVSGASLPPLPSPALPGAVSASASARETQAGDPAGDVTQGALRFKSAEGKFIECPLKHTDVQAEIAGFIARVTVTQEFANPSKEKIEAVYVFPLPHEAAVDGMTMVIGQRRIVGLIRKRDEARKVYEQALARGQTAALLEQERPNVFVQSVGNIEPGQPVKVEITYVDVLSYDLGAYAFHFPMVVGPRYNPASWSEGVGAAPADAAGASGQKTEVPYLKPGKRNGHDIALSLRLDAGVPVRDLKSVNHKVHIEQTGARTATCAIEASDAIPNKDFELRYKVMGEKPEVAVLAHAGSEGDGHFLLMVQPKEDAAALAAPPRELVFLVDVSGSMSGEPTAKVKQTMKLLLAGLGPRDKFQVVTFESQAEKLFPAPVVCSEDNVRKALAFSQNAAAGGGTEMLQGIRAALGDPPDPERVRIVIMLTDGFIGNEAEIVQEVGRRCGDRLRFWCIGIGNSVNRFLVDGVAKHGGGMGKVLSLRSTEAEVKDLVAEVVIRLHRAQIANLAVNWGGLQVRDTYPARIPELWAGRPAVIFGRYSGGGAARIRLSGEAEGRAVSFEVPVELPAKDSGNDALAVTWARRKIESLTDEMAVEGENAKRVEEITQLALDYRLMTRYTSFVAVDEQKLRVAGVDLTAPRKIGVAVQLPEGVSEWAIPANDGGFVYSPKEGEATAPAAGPESYGHGQWGWKQTSFSIGTPGLVVIMLALAILIYFLAGLRRGRFVYVPLSLGLFALAFGMLGTVISIRNVCEVIGGMAGPVDLALFADGVSRALVSTFTGLVVAIGGSFFTLILHARDKHLDRLAAEEDSADGDGRDE